MAYEIDFIGVSKEKCKTDADAICLRYKYSDYSGQTKFRIGVIDGGFEAHGAAMSDHINSYYFDGTPSFKPYSDKTIDFLVVTHPDQDHVVGIKKILENFNVLKIFMNRPWLYVDDLYEKVSDNRITPESLEKRLKDKYKYIAEIEQIAEDNNIPIYEAFQGNKIENELLILSPSKEFYLDLIIESDKTPLEEDSKAHKENTFSKLCSFAKEYFLSLIENWTQEMLRDDVQTSSENESSVVIRGLIDGAGFLLTGDAGIRALNNAVDYMELIGEDIKSEISFYQIPHHGGRHNLGPSILDRMIGNIVNEGEKRAKTAIASVAENSDHPLKMVTNAFIRRGVRVCKTEGKVLWHHSGDMPNRKGWISCNNIEFSDFVEEWED